MSGYASSISAIKFKGYVGLVSIVNKIVNISGHNIEKEIKKVMLMLSDC